MVNGCPPDGLRDLLSPELSLPILPEYQVSRAQVGVGEGTYICICVYIYISGTCRLGRQGR